MQEQIDRASRFVDDLLALRPPAPARAALDRLVSATSSSRRHRAARARLGPDAGEASSSSSTGTDDAPDRSGSSAALAGVGDPPRQRAARGRRARVREEDPDQRGATRRRIELAIEDSGPGVPPELQERLFQPFVTARKREGPRPGTGLGLAIARGIVERHARNHRRRIDRALGGARFDAALSRRFSRCSPRRSRSTEQDARVTPIARSCSSKTTRPFARSTAGCCATPATRWWRRPIARRASARSRSAPSRRDARPDAAARRQRRGRTRAARGDRSPRDPRTKVIVASGAGDTRHMLQAVKAGAYDFLTKPIDPDVLLVVVQRAMAKRRPRAAASRRSRPSSPTRGPRASMVGSSPSFAHAVALAERVAAERPAGAGHRRERHRQGAARAHRPRARAAAATGRSWRSTAARSPRPCSSRRSSAT